MASQHLLPILRAFLLLILICKCYVRAKDYSCALDNSTTYQFPTCYTHSSSSSSYSDSSSSDSSAVLSSISTSSVDNSSGGHHHHHNVHDEELEGMSPSSSSSYSDELVEGISPASPPRPKPPHPDCVGFKPPAIALLKCCLKFEYVAAEYFAVATTGYSLYDLDSSLRGNGSVEGGQHAYLSHGLLEMMKQIAYMNVDNIRTVKKALRNETMDEPRIDIGKTKWADLFDNVTGTHLWPRFDAYRGDNHFLLAGYWLTGFLSKCYIGILDKMDDPSAKRLAGSLAAVKYGQETLFRTLLYSQMHQIVQPYVISVGDMTSKMSQYRDQLLESNGTSAEGLWVPSCLGTAGYSGNPFSVDDKGLPYGMIVTSTCSVVQKALGCFLPDSY